MKKNDLISVIIPIYGVEKYIKKCLDSLLNQTYENYEVIMVDDCSQDGSSIIACDFSRNYPDVFIYIKHEKNLGLAASRNTGIINSKGIWIAFVDSDDWVHPNYLKNMHMVAVEKNVDIIACSYFHTWENGMVKDQHVFDGFNDVLTGKQAVALMRNHSVTRLFKRNLIIRSGFLFPENIKRAEDMPFSIPLISLSSNIGILKDSLYYYLQRENSISNSNMIADFSFYYNAFDLLKKRIDSSFSREIEFRAINEFMYGLLSIMLRAKVKRSELKKVVSKLNEDYPHWKKNEYIYTMRKEKKLFIIFASYKLFFLNKILIKLHDFLKSK